MAGEARRSGHVFLPGFPGVGRRGGRGGLAAHPDVVLLDGGEALIDATREWLVDEERFVAFSKPTTMRWSPRATPIGAGSPRRASTLPASCSSTAIRSHLQAAADRPALPRCAYPHRRARPAGRGAGRFRARFRMSAPAWQMLTLEGCAELYVATMALVEASEDRVRPVHARSSLEARWRIRRAR